MKFLILTLLAVTLASCSSKPKEREFKLTYSVINASSKIEPNWLNDPSNGEADEKDKKKNDYFVSESEHKNKRLCVKSAEARATAKVASEISQYIKNYYEENVSGNQDEAAVAYMNENLAQDAQAFVVGAKVYQTYWEKRKYDMEKGASEDREVYSCNALIKMNKANLASAIKRAVKKIEAQASDKPEVARNLKGADENFKSEQ